MASTTGTQTEIAIPRIDVARSAFYVVGTTPLVLNRMTRKSSEGLLAGGQKKTAAEKQSTLKHDPIAEFRASPYVFDDPTAPTLLAIVSSAFKGAMATAALDLPGTKKAQIGRLAYVEGDLTPVWGRPFLFMAVTRSADINRTPDVRTRAIVPYWAARLEVSYVQPILKAQAIVNLLTAAGLTAGVGDWRPEKGKGNYGQFMVVNEDDAELRRIMAVGRTEQAAAMRDPEPYGSDTAELLSWFQDEVVRRGFTVADDGTVAVTTAAPTARRSTAADAAEEDETDD